MPFAPDFAAEILSPSDSLIETQAKMEEYLASGVRLGWLVDRMKRMVYITAPVKRRKRLPTREPCPPTPNCPASCWT